MAMTASVPIKFGRKLKHFFTLNRAKSPYAVLGVSRLSRKPAIKKRYHSLVKQYHPDLFAFAEGKHDEFHKKLAEINHAYAQLCS